MIRKKDSLFYSQPGSITIDRHGNKVRLSASIHRRVNSDERSDQYILNPRVQGGYRVQHIDFTVESKNLGFTHRLAKCVARISGHFLHRCGINSSPNSARFCCAMCHHEPSDVRYMHPKVGTTITISMGSFVRYKAQGIARPVNAPARKTEPCPITC